MKKRLLSLLLITVMLMSFLPSFAVLGASAQIDIDFFDAETNEKITMLNRVESTYAKINFASVDEDNVIVICAAYDNKDDFLGIKSLETASTAVEYTTPVIAPDGVYTLKIFVWNSLGKMIPLCTEAVLTHGITTIEFDEKILVKAGAYDTASASYDNTIKEVTAEITGTQNVNTRKPYTSSYGYWYRRYVYVTVDLTNEKKAEQVLLNILASRDGTAQGNYIYIDQVEKCPQIGESIPTDNIERVGKIQLTDSVNGNMQAIDITDVYNNAIGTKLCLKIFGWAYAEKKNTSYVKVNADSLKLDITPYVEGKYTVTFDKGAEAIYADRDSEITLPEYSIKIPGQKFTGWSDGTNTYQAGASYKVTKTTRFTATIVDDPDSMTNAQKLLDGKKVIFIGDSNVYWGRAVEARSSKNELKDRQNDKGIFYQICKANYIDVSVTNWTYGSHGWWALFDTEECTVNDSCGGINHEEKLTDRNYDYVFLGLTRSATDEEKLDEYMTHITGLFREANPNVQIIVLAPSMIYGINDTNVVRQGTIDSLKTMEAKYNVKIADWGRIVYDILNGKVTVPNTTQQWVKNTFVVKDKKHVNLLGGYITALMAYCVTTGEKAEGQSFDFFWNDLTPSFLNVASYATSQYTNGDADTNFPEILASETEMRGIQKLVDKYIAEKAYLTY